MIDFFSYYYFHLWTGKRSLEGIGEKIKVEEEIEGQTLLLGCGCFVPGLISVVYENFIGMFYRFV